MRASKKQPDMGAILSTLRSKISDLSSFEWARDSEREKRPLTGELIIHQIPVLMKDKFSN